MQLIAILIAVLGIALIVFKMWLLQGNGKQFYVAFHSRAAGVYALIPWGISCLCLAITLMFESGSQVRTLFIYATIGFLGLGYSAMFLRPSFLKPNSFKWLEREHGDIFTVLILKANKLGPKEWAMQMQTQEDMQLWVNRIRQHELNVSD